MAKITVELTEDMIKLIRCMSFKKLSVRDNKNCDIVQKYDTDKYFGIDVYDLYGGTFLYEQMAFILGKMDKMIPGSDLEVTGPRFDDETMDYFNQLDGYLVEHIVDIFEIILQFSHEGISPGKYTCKDYQHIWTKVK